MNIASESFILLKSAADPTLSKKMSDYMRGQFDYFGVTSPIRKTTLKDQYALSKKLSHDELIMVVHELWQQNERECQYAALDIFFKNKKRILSSDIEDVIVWLCNKSWWDTIDGLASHVIGQLFEKDHGLRDKYTSLWLASDNIWLNRTCLIYQLKYKEKANFELLIKYILALKHKNDFFIQKAIGWSLRQYSRTDADAVKTFVGTTELSNLAKKEALRLIS